MPSWLTSTASKPRSSLDGDEIIRLVDDPNGTPTTGSTTIDALKAYASNVLDVVSYGAQPTDREGVPTVDSAPAINEALAAGEYRTVFVPNGAYLLGSTLKIGRGTRLVCESPEGVIFYKSHTGTMLSNGLGYTTSSDIAAYEGNGGIVIDGGVWDGFTNNASDFDGYSHFALGFGTGITIQYATFLNAIGPGHAVDMAACKGVLFYRCKFLGYALNGGDASTSDCIQLDASTDNGGGSLSFPYFGLEKRKLNQDVMVIECEFGPNPDNADVRFGSHQIGVGSHASVWGEWATRIVVDKCKFDGLGYAGVRVWKWRDVWITNNRFIDCERPIHISATAADSVSSTDSAGTQQGSSDGSVDGLKAFGNSFSGSGDYDLFMGNYSYGSGATTARHKGIRFFDNRSENNGGANGAVAIRYCYDSDFYNNTIDGCTRWFYCTVAASSRDVSITGNRLYNATVAGGSNGGVHVIGVAGIEISRNVMRTCAARGVYVTQSAADGKVSENTFEAIEGSAIYIQSTSVDWAANDNVMRSSCLSYDTEHIHATSSCSGITVDGGKYDSTVPAARLLGASSYANIRPAAQPLYNRATGWTHTGDTSETTKLTLTDVIPANVMGPSGELQITLQSSAAANNANAKTVRVKIGGTTVLQQSLASQRGITTRLILTNKDATNSQIAQGTTQASSFAASTIAMATYSIDTTAALTVTATIQLANSSDSVTIEKLKLAVTYGA